MIVASEQEDRKELQVLVEIKIVDGFSGLIRRLQSLLLFECFYKILIYRIISVSNNNNVSVPAKTFMSYIKKMSCI